MEDLWIFLKTSEISRCASKKVYIYVIFMTRAYHISLIQLFFYFGAEDNILAM